MKIIWLCAVLALLFLIAVFDGLTRRIPDGMVLALAVLFLPALRFLPGAHGAGLFCVSVPLLLLAVFLPGSFGGGDVKLMAAGGLLLGARLILYAFAGGMMAAGVYCVILLMTGKAKRNTKIPMGPFLCAGMAATVFLI